jgi:Protein of unknown function (DUF3040)
VLSDRELDALRDIERRLRWESPELTRLFGDGRLPDDPDRRKRMRSRISIAAAALSGLALLGPRALDETDGEAHNLPPLTRTSPPEVTGARSGARIPATAPTDTAPNGLVHLVIAPWAADDTPPRHDLGAQHQPARPAPGPRRLDQSGPVTPLISNSSPRIATRITT